MALKFVFQEIPRKSKTSPVLDRENKTGDHLFGLHSTAIWRQIKSSFQFLDLTILYFLVWPSALD